MSWAKSIFGFPAPFEVRKSPDDVLRESIKEPRQEPHVQGSMSLGSKVVDAATVISVASGAYKAAGDAIPDVLREGASRTAEKAAETAESVFGEHFTSVKSLWSWGSWGFSLLPGPIRLLLAAAAIYKLYDMYRSVRYGNGGYNTNSNTVNVHVNMPQLDGRCRPVTRTSKDEVRVDIECDAPPVRHPVRKAVTNYTTAVNYHGQLKEISKQSRLLNPHHRREVVEITRVFDELKESNYHDGSLEYQIARARLVLIEANKQIKGYTETVVNKMHSKPQT